MNMSGKLFKKPGNPTLDDSVFGQIEFTSTHGVDMWCHVPSESSGHMILIDAPLAGPTAAQRTFYSRLCAGLADRAAECKAFIALQRSPPKNISGMTVYSVEIGPDNEIASGKFVIELSDADAIEIHRVEFKGGKPETYGVDD
jgi:hypothetical protein